MSTEQIYEAECLAAEAAKDEVMLPNRVPKDQVEQFMVSALEEAGWTYAQLPDIRYDIESSEPRTGQFCVQTDRIRLRPDQLCPFIILHELAHWLRERTGNRHDEQWRGTYVGLVQGAFGLEAAAILRNYFEGYGFDVDLSFASFPDQ